MLLLTQLRYKTLLRLYIFQSFHLHVVKPVPDISRWSLTLHIEFQDICRILVNLFIITMGATVLRYTRIKIFRNSFTGVSWPVKWSSAWSSLGHWVIYLIRICGSSRSIQQFSELNSVILDIVRIPSTVSDYPNCVARYFLLFDSFALIVSSIRIL